jgi:hypothetical protein
MKNLPLFFLTLVMPGLAFSSPFNKSNFQQEVNHVVHATLYDTKGVLFAQIQSEYINNSPDTLNHIYIHLWMNAFNDNQSAFAKQLITQNNFEFHFADETERGYYSDLDFKVNGQRAIWGPHQNHHDIAIVYLNPPLAPGDTLVITTPYTLKFPSARFSRPGEKSHDFFSTQWYPKPAVYDHKGWHPMPYLETGEFYSEFGNFDFYLTIPANYRVASSGILQNPEEIKWLDSLAKVSQVLIESETFTPFPDKIESSPEMKTLHMRQEKVHDFAWFASKRFHVLKDQVLINDGSTIDTWVFFTEQHDQWKKANEYLKASIVFMSELLGPYPWKQMTAVQGINNKGSDMEYPAITVIGQHNSDRDLERVIVHETIHNWFYGILASNERKYPWMDEGFATYYETRYMEEKYPGEKLLGSFSQTLLASFFNLSHIGKEGNFYLNYLLKARQHLDQPAGYPSEDFSLLNYYFMSYQKAALSIKLLDEYFGRDKFDKAMRQYYHQWQFRHPYPDDLRQVMENEASTDLSWFFDELIPTNKKIDLTIKSVSDDKDGYILTIKNKGNLALPFQVAGYRNGEMLKTNRYREFVGTEDLFFPGFGYDRFTIDPFENLPEYDRTNNIIHSSKKWSKGKWPELQVLGSIEDHKKKQVFWVPVLGYNNASGLMPGLAFYNYVFPVRPAEILLMPMYSPQKDNLIGIGRVYYTFYPLNLEKVHSLRLGSQVQRFGLVPGREDLNYLRVENSAKLVFKPALSSSRGETYLVARNSLITRDRIVFRAGERIAEQQIYYINDLLFHYGRKSVLHPRWIDLKLEQADQVVKSSLTANIFFTLNERKEGLSVRFFAGSFLVKPDPPYPVDMRFRLQGMAGRHNYTFDHTFAGRHESAGSLWGNQIYETDGAFKYPTPLGQTWDWITALNVKFDIPKMPLRVFADVATYHNAGSEIIGSEQFPYVTGLQLHMLNDIIQVNFPVIVSPDLKRTAELNKLDSYYKRITFTIRFDRLDPFKALNDLNVLLY